MTVGNDDLVAVGDILRRQSEPVVDVQALFGRPADPAFVLVDGVHPSLAGQQVIAKALVERMTL